MSAAYEATHVDWAEINAEAARTANLLAVRDGGSEWMLETRWRTTEDKHPNLTRAVEERWKYLLVSPGALVQEVSSWSTLMEWGKYSESETTTNRTLLADSVIVFDFYPEQYSEQTGVTERSGTNFRGITRSKLKVTSKGEGIVNALRSFAQR